jgi:hypothetical protein
MGERHSAREGLVIALLSVIVAVESVAIIALARQVGLLHLRAGSSTRRARGRGRVRSPAAASGSTSRPASSAASTS